MWKFYSFLHKLNNKKKNNNKKTKQKINKKKDDFCKGDDKRVKEVFAQYDTDKDNLLTLENFLEFYLLAAVERPNIVWSNLHAHHVRNDLKLASEIEEIKLDFKTLPKFILMQNSKTYEILFSLLDNEGELSSKVWELLNRLPTSPTLMNQILEQKDNWQESLDLKLQYKLVYVLSIIEYLMENKGDEIESDTFEENGETNNKEKNEEEHKQQQQQEKHKENNKEAGWVEEKSCPWRASFIEVNGFQSLFNIFKELIKLNVFNSFQKLILSLLLRIFKNYIIAALAGENANLYKVTQFIRNIQFSLEQISDYFKNCDIDCNLISLESKNSKEINVNEKKNNIDDAANAASGKKNNTAAQEEKKAMIIKSRVEENQDFKTLIKSLQENNLGERVIATFELEVFAKQIRNLIFNILTKTSDFESEDR